MWDILGGPDNIATCSMPPIVYYYRKDYNCIKVNLIQVHTYLRSKCLNG